MQIKRKPEWLRKKIDLGGQQFMRQLLADLQLNTVCQQAACPNIGECFAAGQASFLILGTRCTRQCSFCNVQKHRLADAVDADEPQRLAQAVQRLQLGHVVITSPTRDDLPDGGAKHYVAVMEAIRRLNPQTRVELLIPDFGGNEQSLAAVLAAAPDIIAHNLETVPRLYHIRKGADYRRSLALLQKAAQAEPAIAVKSGFMLGLGENEDEIMELMADIFATGCRYLSIGQYLAPSKAHHPVAEYLSPDFFQKLHEKAMQMGFLHTESAPYVRSSYHAANYVGSFGVAGFS